MKIMILYIISIILAAIADACMDSGGKLIGHSAETISIFVLLIVPFIQKYKGGWGWYIAAYLFLRIGMFDIIYNLVAGNAITYHDITSFWGMILGLFNPPVIAELFGRAVFLFAGIIIPLQNIK